MKLKIWHYEMGEGDGALCNGAFDVYATNLWEHVTCKDCLKKRERR